MSHFFSQPAHCPLLIVSVIHILGGLFSQVIYHKGYTGIIWYLSSIVLCLFLNNTKVSYVKNIDIILKQRGYFFFAMKLFSIVLKNYQIRKMNCWGSKGMERVFDYTCFNGQGELNLIAPRVTLGENTEIFLCNP